MNLKLVFRIYFGFGALMTVLMLVAPASMMEGYGMTLTDEIKLFVQFMVCLLYTSPSPRDKRQSRMPSSA